MGLSSKSRRSSGADPAQNAATSNAAPYNAPPPKSNAAPPKAASPNAASGKQANSPAAQGTQSKPANGKSPVAQGGKQQGDTTNPAPKEAPTSPYNIDVAPVPQTDNEGSGGSSPPPTVEPASCSSSSTHLVPRALLYEVAGGLGAACIILLIALIFVIWRYKRPRRTRSVQGRARGYKEIEDVEANVKSLPASESVRKLTLVENLEKMKAPERGWAEIAVLDAVYMEARNDEVDIPLVGSIVSEQAWGDVAVTDEVYVEDTGDGIDFAVAEEVYVEDTKDGIGYVEVMASDTVKL
ncbi:hypothetical protein EIP86_006079 [Pleurotus ostreatoroseus]|nr:hypothetical protein EIP86_006079 [Pleurotus ostreatoroseus]